MAGYSLSLSLGMSRPAVLFLLVGVLVAGSAAYGMSWMARESRSQDVCLTGAPAGADLLGQEDSPLPWRWACVYERASGEVLRVEHTAFAP